MPHRSPGYEKHKILSFPRKNFWQQRTSILKSPIEFHPYNFILVPVYAVLIVSWLLHPFLHDHETKPICNIYYIQQQQKKTARRNNSLKAMPNNAKYSSIPLLDCVLTLWGLKEKNRISLHTTKPQKYENHWSIH